MGGRLKFAGLLSLVAAWIGLLWLFGRLIGEDRGRAT
jgi:hypothetical protein